MINILVVDDSKIARTRILERISKFGIEHTIIAEAEDGVQALDKFIQLKPNLIITDLEMPNMSGMDLVKEIRSLNSSIHIIIISSLLNEQIKQTLKSDRFVDFIKKPIDDKIVKMLLLKIEHNLIKG